MISRPHLAKCSPDAASMAHGFDEIEATLSAKEDMIEQLRRDVRDAKAADIHALTSELATLRPECERLANENEDLRAKLNAVVRAHNIDLAKIAELYATVGQ